MDTYKEIRQRIKSKEELYKKKLLLGQVSLSDNEIIVLEDRFNRSLSKYKRTEFISTEDSYWVCIYAVTMLSTCIVVNATGSLCQMILIKNPHDCTIIWKRG